MTPLDQIKRPALTDIEVGEIRKTQFRSGEHLALHNANADDSGSRFTYDHSLEPVLRLKTLSTITLAWSDYANQIETECAERDEYIEELRGSIEMQARCNQELQHQIQYLKHAEMVHSIYPEVKASTFYKGDSKVVEKIITSTIMALVKRGLIR
jgi:hypothetical protein